MTTSATVMNLTLPTSVGGDVIRVAMGQDAGIPVSEGSAAAVLDRVIGLLVLMALVWVGLFWINIQLALVTGLAGMGFVWLGVRLSQDHGHRLRIPVFLERFSDAISMDWKHRPATVVSLTISFVAHIGSIAVAVILAQGMGVELSALGAFITFPAVILASAIPLSVGGWGLRELAAIPLMGLAGLVPEAAAAIATLFAATQLISALSGLVAFQLFKLFRSRS